jgi:hypothetical protein
LRDRPSLDMEISGYVGRDRDAEGYRQELLRKKMKTEKFLVLAKEHKQQPGQTPDTTELLPLEEPTWLKAVYKKENFPKPRTALGFVKDLPDEEMRKLILAHTTVGQEQLQGLAKERVHAVKNFLVTQGKVEAQRLFQKESDIYKQPENKELTASRVELGAAVK